MRLSQRIHDICSCVSQGESIADIGTDHAYVPMRLIKDGISDYAIMSDISEGSLAKAVETFELAHIDYDENQFRLGDGLEKIDFSEVDDIIIAGLGGYTIIDILKADLAKSKSFKKLILQPRKFSGNLRHFLYTNGWDIVSEKLSPEGKFVCEIITATPSDEQSRHAPFDENNIRWKYPETFINADKTLLKQRLDWKFSSIDEEIQNLSNSKTDNKELIDKLLLDKTNLKDLLDKSNNA